MTTSNQGEASLPRTADSEPAGDDQFHVKLLILEDQRSGDWVEERVLVGLKAKEANENINQK